MVIGVLVPRRQLFRLDTVQHQWRASLSLVRFSEEFNGIECDSFWFESPVLEQNGTGLHHQHAMDLHDLLHKDRGPPRS